MGEEKQQQVENEKERLYADYKQVCNLPSVEFKKRCGVNESNISHLDRHGATQAYNHDAAANEALEKIITQYEEMLGKISSWRAEIEMEMQKQAKAAIRKKHNAVEAK